MNNCKRVYAVRSPEEARRVLEDSEKTRIRFLLYRLFILIWVPVVNSLLWILKFILFKKTGYIRRKEFNHIVVYTVGTVGDNVVMLPALAALRNGYPGSRITVIVNCQEWDPEGALGVLGPSHFKDRLVVLNDHPVRRDGFRFLMDENKFDGVKCDLFVNLSPFGNRGCLGAVVREMIFAKKLGATGAIGFRMATLSKRGIFNKVQRHFVQNEPRRSKQILREIGLEPVEGVDFLANSRAAKESVVKKLQKRGVNADNFFILNPGAKFRSKCWPAKRFGEIAGHIAGKYGSFVVVTGTASERGIADEVVKASNGSAISIAGETSVQEMVELLRIARGCVTNDTGTMHIAAMAGTPTAAIFSTRHSPTDWLPAGRKVVSVFCVTDCIYCYNDFCESPDCLNGIKVDDVVRALDMGYMEGTVPIYGRSETEP